MNRTITFASIVSGVAGAGIAYAFKSVDTFSDNGIPYFERNSNSLNPIVRILPDPKQKFETAIKVSQELVKRFKDEIGAPGLVIGVSVDGKIVWEEGMGYSNLETRTLCHSNTAMRIASISKAITATILAKLYEAKKIDLDASVYNYVKFFPKKEIDGEEVDITIRHLASHTSGVRHYKKKGEKKDGTNRDSGKEFYFKDKIENTEKSIDFFKNDELLFKPGTSFEYTTHGYTLLSAAMEVAAKKTFTELALDLFKVLGLENTHLDYVHKVIYERANYYDKNKQGRIVNAELADVSYKWAGGGFVSTVGDLLKFGNIMLYSYQQQNGDKPGYLKKETVQEMWTPVDKAEMKWGGNSARYGLGWTIVPKSDEVGMIEDQKFHVGHSGGAVGASSVLLIVPKGNQTPKEKRNESNINLPKGVVVAILVNLESISCRNLAKKIADEFYKI